MRKGVEARRTRSVGRVARLQNLRAQRAARRDQVGQVKLELDSGLPSGKIVAELKDVSVRFGDRVIVDGFSSTVLRGDKVGLIGPNGAGKTTLLNAISGVFPLSAGSVRFEGRDITTVPLHRRVALGIGRTFQGEIGRAHV